MRCSSTAQLGMALVGTEVGTTRDPLTVAAITSRISALISAPVRSLRAGGSCALGCAAVAAGRLDAFYEVGFGGPWDVAAAILLVEEAGGAVLDPAGGPFDLLGRRVLVACSAELGADVAAVLARCPPSPSEPAAPQ